MRRGLAALAILLPVGAHAHAFDTGAGAFAQVVEGAGVPLRDPALLLALLPLGLTLGIWRTDGLPRIWPALVAGLVAGAAAAPLAGIGIAFAAILTGLAVALLGVLARDWPVWLMAAAAAGVGLVAGMTALEGHAFGGLPVAIYAGVLGGALLVVAVPSGLVSFTRTEFPAWWITLGWRIAASWTGAVALMLAALRFA